MQGQRSSTQSWWEPCKQSQHIITVPTVSRCFRSDATKRSGFTTWELSREGSLELAVKLVFIQRKNKIQLSRPARIGPRNRTISKP